MSVRAHQGPPELRSDIGRPPPVRSARCDALMQLDRQCSNHAIWLLPEMTRCAHHVPGDLIPVLAARAQDWAVLADALWDRIRTAHPCDPDGYEL